jgi:hypothetical protein
MRRAVAMTLVLITACGKLHTSDPPRTATEQFLMTVAVERAVARLTAEALHGHAVYLDSSRLKTYVYKNNQLTEQDPSPEHKFLIGELRARLIERGVRMVDAPEKAKIIAEVWSGGLGIDRYDTVVGIPSLYFTGVDRTLDDQLLNRTPEIAVYKSKLGLGVSGVSFAAYWADTGELIAVSHPPEGFGERKDVRYLLIFQRKTGNVPTIQPSKE